MPVDEKMRIKLEKYDDYGFKKLQCENLLKKIFSNNYYIPKNQALTEIELIDIINLTITNTKDKNISVILKDKLSQIDFSNKKYIFLRLPDVIGPFDESYRIWCYLEWIKNSSIHPIELEKVDVVRKLSFISRDDVNRTILKLIFDKNKIFENLFNNEYNISFDEIITLKELLNILFFLLAEINKDLNNNGYYYFLSDEWVKTFLPSVTIGPISNAKAKNCGLFQQEISLIEYLRKTVEFFEKEARKYDKEFSDMVTEMPKELRKILKNN